MFMSVGMIVLIMIPFNSSSGGIGIHAGLRNQCRKACGFESHLEDKCCGVVKLGDTGIAGGSLPQLRVRVPSWQHLHTKVV